MREGLFVLSLMCFAPGAIAAAQVEAGPDAPAEAAPAPGNVPPPSPATPGPSDDAARGAAVECVPGCRSGFVCLQGACISACNPPCAAGERCTATGECIIPQRAAPPLVEELDDYQGTREHDGFMVRLTLGLGVSLLHEEGFIGNRAFSADYSGLGYASSLDIGASLVENLVLHARLAILDITSASPDGESDYVDTGLSLNAGLFAPAITYYVMPINIYLTGAIGLCVMNFFHEDSDDASSTAFGLGVNLDIGKEWWIANAWGLGLAGRLWYSRNSDSDEELGLEAVDDLLSFALLFSVTYQ